MTPSKTHSVRRATAWSSRRHQSAAEPPGSARGGAGRRPPALRAYLRATLCAEPRRVVSRFVASCRVALVTQSINVLSFLLRGGRPRRPRERARAEKRPGARRTIDRAAAGRGVRGWAALQMSLADAIQRASSAWCARRNRRSGFDVKKPRMLSMRSAVSAPPRNARVAFSRNAQPEEPREGATRTAKAERAKAGHAEPHRSFRATKKNTLTCVSGTLPPAALLARRVARPERTRFFVFFSPS